MRALFQKMLSVTAEGWTQSQREAMVDLCLLGIYSDDLVSLPEQQVIDDNPNRSEWESGISFSGYLQRNIPKIRSIKDDAEKVEELLQSIGDRLGNPELKRQASDELAAILATDGTVQVEEDFLAMVKTVLGV